MTLSIPVDESTLRKLTEAAERETKPIAEWAREQLTVAAERKLKPNVATLEHLKKHFGSIDDPSFEAPAREAASRDVPAFD